jgi:hypothetical protein
MLGLFQQWIVPSVKNSLIPFSVWIFDSLFLNIQTRVFTVHDLLLLLYFFIFFVIFVFYRTWIWSTRASGFWNWRYEFMLILPVDAQTTDLGQTHYLALRAPTLDLWLEIAKSGKFLLQEFIWITKF